MKQPHQFVALAASCGDGAKLASPLARVKKNPFRKRTFTTPYGAFGIGRCRLENRCFAIFRTP
jgi:hypothetical protein